LGINGERFVTSVFERLIGKKRLQKGWYQIKHQDWGNNYNYGTGVDIEIHDEDDKPLIDAEVKNWKTQSKPYGTDVALKEIHTRFWQSTAPIKILFISFLHLLTYEARDLIKQAGIEIIEIGNWIVKATWKETLKQFMFQHYHRLRNLLNLKTLRQNKNKSRRTFVVHNSSDIVVNSLVCNSSGYNSNSLLQLNKQHDTNIDHKLSEYIINNNNSHNGQRNTRNT